MPTNHPRVIARAHADHGGSTCRHLTLEELLAPGDLDAEQTWEIALQLLDRDVWADQVDPHEGVCVYAIDDDDRPQLAAQMLAFAKARQRELASGELSLDEPRLDLVELAGPTLGAPVASIELLGFKATITRSAGADHAVVIFVDGPEEGPDREHHEMPDGSPRCRILLNDEPVYAPVAFKEVEPFDASSIEADPKRAQEKGL
jgi:hypothetical protein